MGGFVVCFHPADVAPFRSSPCRPLCSLSRGSRRGVLHVSFLFLHPLSHLTMFLVAICLSFSTFLPSVTTGIYQIAGKPAYYLCFHCFLVETVVCCVLLLLRLLCHFFCSLSVCLSVPHLSGIAARQVLRFFCPEDPPGLLSLYCRFSRTVAPGDVLEVSASVVHVRPHTVPV